MHENIGRFILTSFLLFIGSIGLVIVAVVLFIPAAITLYVFWVALAVLVAIVGFLMVLSFIWYLGRKEPEIENPNNNYSLNQSKDG